MIILVKKKITHWIVQSVFKKLKITFMVIWSASLTWWEDISWKTKQVFGKNSCSLFIGSLPMHNGLLWWTFLWTEVVCMCLRRGFIIVVDYYYLKITINLESHLWWGHLNPFQKGPKWHNSAIFLLYVANTGFYSKQLRLL